MSRTQPSLLEWGSKMQIQSIGLRYEVLRKPLGMFFTPEELMAESGQIHVGMVIGESVLAVLLLKLMDGNVAKMRQVAVAESFQGQGLGKQLIRFSEQICREKQVKRIELHARKSAVQFYQTLGYQTQGNEFEEVGIPHMAMFLDL